MVKKKSPEKKRIVLSRKRIPVHHLKPGDVLVFPDGREEEVSEANVMGGYLYTQREVVGKKYVTVRSVTYDLRVEENQKVRARYGLTKPHIGYLYLVDSSIGKGKLNPGVLEKKLKQ